MTRSLCRNGFSLIELLVVLFVMALLASVAVLSFPGADGDLRREAEQFAARITAARDEAVVTAMPVAIVIDGDGYRFERREEGEWRPLIARAMRGDTWNGGTTPAMAARSDGPMRVVFDSLGLASSEARIDLSHGTHVSRIRIARDGTVTVKGP